MKRLSLKATALFSLIMNGLFGLYHALLGVADGSWWYLTMAVYYLVLGVMRFAVLLAGRSAEVSPTFVRRFTGGTLLFLAVVLAGTAYLAVEVEQAGRHHEIVMITIALYAFVKITLAILHLARARRGEDPIATTLRSISMADALASMFSLQRSMLVSFEGMSVGDVRLFNILTGTAVYLLVALLGIYLIRERKNRMAKSKLVEANEKIAEAVTDGYKKIEKGTVDGYKKIEEGVVKGYTKIEDKFVEQFLTREGETVEEAKKRLKGEE